MGKIWLGLWRRNELYQREGWRLRQIMLWLAALLAALLLLFAGLTAAVRGMQELLALVRPVAAFTLRRGLEGRFEIIFGGYSYLVNFGQIVERLKAWGAQLSLTF